jgi:cell division protein FtsI/penicillin-binding protein 2
MSWKLYQQKLGREPAPVRRRKRSVPVWAGAAAFGAFIFLLFGVRWFDFTGRDDESPRMGVPSPVPGGPNPKDEVAGLLGPMQLAVGAEEVRVLKENAEWSVDLTIEPALQKFIRKKLEQYRVDWAGVAAVDPRTGAVLATADHSEKEPSGGNLALRATFPAASIFKIVTAAAALEEGGLRRDTTVSYSGNMYGIGKRQVLRDSGREGMTFAEAFAKSANVVFGKIGARNLQAGQMDDYAHRFGFNSVLPFEVQVAPSTAEIPRGDAMEEARTAAGFGEVTLSPLHGALLAASILNEGMMMEPFVIRRIRGENGEVRYTGKPRLWRQAVSAVTAREMRRMMATTLTDGTALRSFRRSDRNPVLANLQMGGKTGSLTGKNPPGKNEWFVGYARSNDRQLAVGVVIVSERYWRVKPSELVRDIFEFEFGPRRAGTTL